jgi:predicted Zn-dependent protease
MRQIFKIAICLSAASVMLIGCTTGKLWSFDEASEVEAGSKQHERILGQIGAYNDTKISDFVSTIGNKIASTSDRPDLRWHFTVADSAIPNAFATQGGYVYITRGMLALLQSDTELAAILSHEIAHICAQDTPHKQAVGDIMGLGVLGMIVAAPALLLVPQLAAAPAGAGMAAISRKDELNADRLGTEYLRRAGYPPETMQTVMEMLESMETYEHEQQKAAGRETSRWWHRVYASHPTTEKRQEKLSNATRPNNLELPSTSQNKFFSLLDGLEFGSSKYEGITYGHKRYFMQWNIAMEIPDGWVGLTDYKGSELWLVRRDGKARMLMQRITLIQVDQLCEWLINWMKPTPITESKSIREYENPSCTGVAHKSTPTFFGHHENIFRAGIIAEGKTVGNGYLFRGYSDDATFAENDSIFLLMAKSVEVLQTADKKPKPPTLHIRISRPGDKFLSLAHNSRIKDNNAESLLRLLNRRYPNGEPVEGEFIKIIE